jgi:hypothetical protein
VTSPPAPAGRQPRLAIVTPTYGPDLELFSELHASVLRFAPESAVHHLIVPDADVARFGQFRGPRCEIVAERDLLPRRILDVTWVNPVLKRTLPGKPRARLAALNLRRPLMPIRGWVMQQLLKLAVVSAMDADVVLLLDSDVQLVRPVRAETFMSEGRVLLYRLERGVDDTLPRHLEWHRAAHRLLGLPEPEVPAPDYVSSLMFWDPAVVRALLARVAERTGADWMDAVGSRRDISEWTLYGVFVDQVLGKDREVPATSSSFCHSYWETTPLDAAAATDFVAGMADDDVAVLIQSKSGTTLDARRAALSRTLDRVA